MYPETQSNGRKAAVRYRVAALLALGMAGAFVPAAAQAQELTHRFLNPSFGGNPFYSEHLLGIANIHRPAEPEDDEEPQTPEELLVSQIRASLTAQQSSGILTRIQNAQPGDTGTFTVGDQQISFARTATQTTVTFTNTRTGETSQLIIPVAPPSPNPFPFSNSATPLSAGRSAEQALGAVGVPSFGSSLGVSRPAGQGQSEGSTLLPGFPPL